MLFDMRPEVHMSEATLRCLHVVHTHIRPWVSRTGSSMIDHDMPPHCQGGSDKPSRLGSESNTTTPYHLDATVIRLHCRIT